MKVGIIGTGRHGTRYANHIINDLPELELTAISRRTSEGGEQAKMWEARWHADWRELVKNPSVEAVIVTTTPNLNVDIANACIEAKKPLLIEKPLGVDAQAAAEIVKKCDSAGLPLTVGHTLRYNSTVQAMRNELPRAGKLYSFHASQRLEQTLHEWLDDPKIAGGGVILHTAVHVFDALRYIIGREIKRVRATMYCRHNYCLEDIFIAMIEMEKGLVGTVDASKVGPARSGRFEFVGEKGQLQGDQVHGIIEFIHQAEIKPLSQEKPVSTLVPLLRDWRAYLTGHGANPIPGEEGFAAVKICEACLQSARENKWVEL